MPSDSLDQSVPAILLIAASRGLGLAMAAEFSGTSRAMVLMAPGWVRTEMGGSDAPLTLDESVPSLVNVLLKKKGNAGLEYLDYLGRTVAW